MTSNQRIIGLDLFRILATFVVFLFHSKINSGCSYGVFNNFIHMGAIFMTGFFMLSGFVHFLTYRKKEILKIEETKKFYIKKIIDIFLIYYFVAILYVVFIGTETPGQNLLLFPIEALGIQTVFTSLFSFTHNGGTWFISCLFLAYLLYPFLQYLALNLKKKEKIIIIIILSFILLYSPFIVSKFDVYNIYSNPFFRILEFSIGVFLSSLIIDREGLKTNAPNQLFAIISFLLELALLIVLVTIGINLNIGVNDYMLYNLVCLPIFVLMILSAVKINSEKLGNSHIVRYLSELSYTFFLAQFFTWPIVNSIVDKFGITKNIIVILLCIVICTIISLLLHECVEKRIKKLKKKLAF